MDFSGDFVNVLGGVSKLQKRGRSNGFCCKRERERRDIQGANGITPHWIHGRVGGQVVHMDLVSLYFGHLCLCWTEQQPRKV